MARFSFLGALILTIGISLAASSFSDAPMVQAGAAHTVEGFAWSETIGWLSFNSSESGSPFEYGVSLGTPYESSGATYRALYDASDPTSGYAWSGTVGWVSFRDGDVLGCPVPIAGSCNARLNVGTGQVTGWAKALTGNVLEGWDGWISLSDTRVSPTYATTFSSVTNKFSGYSWGGEVVGWLSWNCASSPGCTTDYSVRLKTSSLTVAVAGTGAISGLVTTADTRINCSGDSLEIASQDCQENYGSGSVVEMSAATDAGSGAVFERWENLPIGSTCVVTSPSCTLTMTSPASVSARFGTGGFALQYGITNDDTVRSLAVYVGGAPRGSCTVSLCAVSNIAVGSAVEIRATGGALDTLDHWSLGSVCDGQGAICTFTLAADVATFATFAEPIESICNDGLDNDGDSLVDAADPDCVPVCPPLVPNPANPTQNGCTRCNNGLDDDGNGDIDGADPDCSNQNRDTEGLKQVEIER